MIDIIAGFFGRSLVGASVGSFVDAASDVAGVVIEPSPSSPPSITAPVRRLASTTL